MDINKLDVDKEPAAHCLPSLLEPGELDIVIDNEMQVWITVLLKFEDANIRRCSSEIALEIGPQFCKCVVEITDRVSMNFRGIKRQGDKSAKFEPLRNFSDGPLVPLRLARTAVAAAPAFAVNPVESCVLSLWVETAHRIAPAVFTALRSVSINL